jgi:predicted short-subunit dehydrogenase-like oxidoreductase (DUF2520 family)
MNKIFYILGTGKTGSAFAVELKDIGCKIEFLSDRNRENLNKLSSVINPVSVSENIEADFIKNSDVIFLSVQDKNINDAISEIKNLNLDLKGKIFIHNSGAITSDIFRKLEIDPELCLSLHPVQTFDKIYFENNHLLKGIYFGIEGGQKAKSYFKKIIKILGSDYLDIPADKKNLYHAACVIASNFLVTMLNVSSEVMNNIGIERSKTFEIFKPLIERTLKNIEVDGLVNSLTGPFDRNDVEVISNHLNSINKELPSLIPFYTLMGMETVKVAFKKESMNLKNVIEILDLMNEYIKTESTYSEDKKGKIN